MADTNHTNALTAEIDRYDDPLLVSERVAVAAFLAGYSGGTRTSYTPTFGSLPAGAMTATSTR